MKDDDSAHVYKNSQDRAQVSLNRFNSLIQQQTSFQNPFSLIHLERIHSIEQSQSLITTPNHLYDLEKDSYKAVRALQNNKFAHQKYVSNVFFLTIIVC